MRKEKETTLNGKRLKVTQLGFEEGMDPEGTTHMFFRLDEKNRSG